MPSAASRASSVVFRAIATDSLAAGVPASGRRAALWNADVEFRMMLMWREGRHRLRRRRKAGPRSTVLCSRFARLPLSVRSRSSTIAAQNGRPAA